MVESYKNRRKIKKAVETIPRIIASLLDLRKRTGNRLQDVAMCSQLPQLSIQTLYNHNNPPLTS